MRAFWLLVIVALSACRPMPVPLSVTFDEEAYTTALRYEIGYFACTDIGVAPEPQMIDSLGLPTSGNGVGIVAPLPARPLGCFWARVRQVDESGLISPWSSPPVSVPSIASVAVK
jgi:hypothetical protein